MFVDTNVIVYARMPGAPLHDEATSLLDSANLDPRPAFICNQIIREYYATVTRQLQWSNPLTRREAIADIEMMREDFITLEDGPIVASHLIQICRTINVGGRQIHDANIVATMLAHGEFQLLTFNRSDFRRFADLIDIVPT